MKKLKDLPIPEEPMTPKELAHMIYQPDKTSPGVVITKFSLTLDMGNWVKTVRWDTKKGMYTTEAAKRGKCLVKDRN